MSSSWHRWARTCAVHITSKLSISLNIDNTAARGHCKGMDGSARIPPCHLAPLLESFNALRVNAF
jgi:hypothetical protein